MESIHLIGNSSLGEDIYVKIREASQVADLHMSKCLETDKLFQSIHVELLSSTFKLLETVKCVENKVES